MVKLLLRCDGSKTIGLGHVTRMLSLAKQLREMGCFITFAMRSYPTGLQQVQKENFPIYIVPSYKTYSQWLPNIAQKYDIFIGDVRDNLPPHLITLLQTKNIFCVAIDEISTYAKECNLTFYPPHSSIQKKLYKGKVFQGLEYTILRQEFYQAQQKKETKTQKNLLIMLGGTDAHNLTLEVLKRILSLTQHFTIYLILSKTSPFYTKIKQKYPHIHLYSYIKDMATFLTSIDYAIITFGSSAYELLAKGVFGIHIALDDDHWQASEYFVNNGLALRYKKEDIHKIIIPKKVISPIVKKNVIAQTILQLYKKDSFFLFDLDATLTQYETLPYLAQHCKLKENLDLITQETQKGTIDFSTSLEQRIQFFSHCSITKIANLFLEVALFENIITFLKQNKHRCAIITSNLDVWVTPLLETIGIPFYTSTTKTDKNHVIHISSILQKADIVRYYQQLNKQVIVIGDGANDIEAMKQADFGIVCALVHPPIPQLQTIGYPIASSEKELLKLLKQL